MQKVNEAQLRDSLIACLTSSGNLNAFTQDLVEKYISFWKVDRKLMADINRRGVTYEDKSSSGYMMRKQNPSIKDKVLVNRQMLQILQQLKIDPGQIGGEADEGEYNL